MENVHDLAQSIGTAASALSSVLSISQRARQSGASEDYSRELNDAIIEMQELLIQTQNSALQMQARNSTLVVRVSKLESEVANKQNWEAETTKYVLKDIDRGFMAYSLREEFQNEETLHFLCTKCYGERIKSILNRTPAAFQRLKPWECPRCDRNS